MYCESMENFTDLIDAFGGTTEFAEMMGKPVGTIGSWKSRKGIPEKHFPEIIRHARQRKIRGVTFESLYAMRRETA